MTVVIIVDPYDLRSWGSQWKLESVIYPQNVMPRLLRVLARSDMTIVVVGGSTVARIKPDTLKDVFGRNEKTFNWSIAAVRPADLTLVFQYLLKMKHLKRIIISVDATLMDTSDQNRAGFPVEYYAPSIHDIGVDFDYLSLAHTLYVIRNGAIPPSPTKQKIKRSIVEQFVKMKMLHAALALSKDKIFSDSRKNCNNFPALNAVLLPYARQFRAKGVAVDFLIPPYSLAAYADFYASRKVVFFARSDQLFSNLMKFKQCLVDAVASIEGARIHAFDNRKEITENLKFYSDPTHIIDQSVYKLILEHVRDGTALLERENWQQYESLLKQRVSSFEIPTDQCVHGARVWSQCPGEPPRARPR